MWGQERVLLATPQNDPDTSQLLSQRRSHRSHRDPSSIQVPLLSPSLSYDHISFNLERCITGSQPEIHPTAPRSLSCLDPWPLSVIFSAHDPRSLPQGKDYSFLPLVSLCICFFDYFYYLQAEMAVDHMQSGCWSWRSSGQAGRRLGLGDSRRQRRAVRKQRHRGRERSQQVCESSRCLTDPGATLSILKPGFRNKL